MTSISSISTSTPATSLADELLQQQQLRDALKVGTDAAAKALDMSSTALSDALKAGQSLKDIAASKNVNFSTVQTAVTDAAKPQLDQAVQSGAVTSSQANNLLAKITSGNSAAPATPSVGGRDGRDGHRGMGKVVQSGEDAAATALGMSSSDLKTALQSGQTLKDVAASKNVDFASVQSAISDAVKPQLDQAVQSGRLTGTQEQDLLTKLTSGGNTTPSAGATYSTSGSVAQAPDSGLVVNTTA